VNVAPKHRVPLGTAAQPSCLAVSSRVVAKGRVMFRERQPSPITKRYAVMIVSRAEAKNLRFAC
jgi:hypothetical protein